MYSSSQEAKTSLSRRLWETLRLILLALDPRTDRAPRVYEILSTHNNLAEKSLYLNMGHWEEARKYDEACKVLAQKLGEYGDLKAGDRVLDAGCGFGDQDRYFLAAFGLAKIWALNLTRSQLEVARVRHPLPQIEWIEGSATAIPLEKAVADRVIGLESAFHFVTRTDFFREAMRVLKPGGSLALADVVVSGEKRNFRERWQDKIGHRMWQVPRENLYPMDQYVAHLREAGFVDVEWEDISQHVFKPFEEFARKRVRDPEVKKRLNPLLRFAWSVPRDVMSGTRYVLVRAKKPL